MPLETARLRGVYWIRWVAKRHTQFDSMARPRSVRSLGAATALAVGFGAAAADWRVPLMPPASDAVRQGFVRVINHADTAGEVSIRAVDDSGNPFGPITLAIAGRKTRHFNSDDLESGNPPKGLSEGTGAGEGSWRLVLSSDLDIEVLSYIRTRDGFVTTMRDVARRTGGGYRVPFFNPGSNQDQVSSLRLTNPGEEEVQATVTGVDGSGALPGSPVTLALPAGATRTLSAADLESGGPGREGALGDGDGKWLLLVESDGDLVVTSVLQSPTGHLTNLTAAPRNVDATGAHVVPFFPAAGQARQGFVRVINHSGHPGAVEIAASDDSDWAREPIRLSLDAFATVHFNSDDLELGSLAKGLSGGVGSGTGPWRLRLATDLEIEVLAYLRTADGFVTAMHDVVPETAGVYRVPIFNPGTNHAQVSTLWLLNPGADDARVTIRATDDAGRDRWVRLSVPGGVRYTFSAWQLEHGDYRLTGVLGDGAGKWRLVVHSNRPLEVMSLLESPTGHVSNLSAAPPRRPFGAAADVLFRTSLSGLVQSSCVGCHRAGGDAGDTRLVFVSSANALHEARNLAVLRDFIAEVEGGAALLLDKAAGAAGHAGGQRVSTNSAGYVDLGRVLDGLAAPSGAWLRPAEPAGVAEGGTATVEVVVSPAPREPLRIPYVTVTADADRGTDDATARDFAVETAGSVEVGTDGIGTIEVATFDDDEIERADGEYLAVRLVASSEDAYDLGTSSSVAVRIDEGVCDRTPAIRDRLIDTVNVVRGYRGQVRVDGCGGVRDVDLAGVNRFETGRLSSIRERDLLGLSNLFSLALCKDQASLYSPRGALETLPPGLFAHTPGLLDRLRFLTISGCSISELPEGLLSGFAQLQRLSLSEPVTRLPQFGRMARLSITRSRLEHLPARAFADTELSELFLQTNEHLATVSPDAFAGMPGLERLALDETAIREVPRTVFGGLSSLVWLQFTSNRIEDIDGLVLPSGLEHLNLNGVPLRELPGGVLSGLSRLKDFRLERYASDFPLRLAPDAFHGLAALESLQLAENRMAELPPGIFAGLHSLRRVRLNDNVLQSLPAGLFDGLTQLEAIDLTGNPGAPFSIVLDLERVDGALLDDGPARLRVTSVTGLPASGALGVSTFNATADADTVRFERGATEGGEFSVTSGGDGAGHTGLGPLGEVSQSSLEGLEFRVGAPIVLFERSDNRMPLPARAIPARRLQVSGHSWTGAMDRCFADFDGDALSYRGQSHDATVVTVEAGDGGLSFAPRGEGAAVVTVFAADPSGIEVSQDVEIVVEPRPDPSSFHIHLDFIGPVTESQRRAVEEAADQWMSIVTGDLPEVPVTGLPDCAHGTRVFTGDVDDLRISVTFTPAISNYAGTGAPARLRDQSGLPFLGDIWLRASPLAVGDGLRRTALHEIGHALGFFPPIWDELGYFHNPSRSLGAGADTHFSGPLAVQAFDDAGGASYTARSKVPLHNSGAVNSDVHWAFPELMYIGGGRALSAITVQLFADLGYTVDVTQAEAYELPRGYRGAGHRPGVLGNRRRIDPQADILLDAEAGEHPDGDLLPVAIEVVDEEGAVVRTLWHRPVP